ncbi:MAG: putative peptidoglycan glycosyltransferase FtsW [Spirochaetaceae bacterium]|jgi:cell division protein FtsW|nr:putative peptidoglycan glycosyltransferase FtsW [Spirochaetaceae bacterium]
MKMAVGDKKLRWERVFQSREDLLLLIFLLLVGLGAAALFSSSYNFCRIYLNDPLYMIRRQLIWIAIGSFLAFAVTRIPLEKLKDSVPWILAVVLLLNLMTYVPGISVIRGGARRWIELGGFSFQPSELVKVALVLYLGRMLEKNRKRLDDMSHVIMPLFVVTLFLTGIIYFQNDFSSAVFVFMLSMILFFIAGVSLKNMAIMLGFSAIPMVLMVLARSYRIERILTWLSPMKDPTGTGYQILKAREALIQGGFWGVGIGQGQEKIGFSAAHSDFVIAVVGEEAGFLGVVILLTLFYLLMVKGFGLALSRKSLFSFYVMTGLICGLFFQVLINFAVVCGFIPVTGIPLPLFSSGGSSTLTAFFTFGLLLNLSREGKR